MTQPSLFDEPADGSSKAGRRPGVAAPPDQAARDFAVDPAHDVVLEASAGTGKTRVLVDRYVRLIEAGVDPSHILAVTFTRKAAAEMRDRVLTELRRRGMSDGRPEPWWQGLKDRIADIEISTIDAFCFALLREFPLEADVDPDFEIADETEMARFASEALDLAFRAARHRLTDDEPLRLLFTRIKTPVLRDAIGSLLDRRHVAVPAVAAFVRQRAPSETADVAAVRFVERLREVLTETPHRSALFDDGPVASPEFQWLHGDLLALDEVAADGAARVPHLRLRLERHFLTKSGSARKRVAQTGDAFVSPDARRRHETAVAAVSPAIKDVLDRLEADINGLLARGLLRLLALAGSYYERVLGEHALLDFAGMLHKAVALLSRQEEFARSRLKLQARYHHILVDEFQDTSRLQWRLIELLIDAWGEGEGAADAPTSVFIVGDRKQSIYRFRHADVTLLDEAARKIAAIRPNRPVRQAIAHSFRAVPELLAFVNALAIDLVGDPALDERFRYEAADQFPDAAVADGARRDGQPVLGLIAEASLERSAAAVADEVVRVLASSVVRDLRQGTRPAQPDDIAILFRARAGHQYFEEALEARGVRTYVYKGLGFFDAPEVQDLQALLRYLARPESDLRAAELIRSRVIRLSDVGLTALAPACAAALGDPAFDVEAAGLDGCDAALLVQARVALARWRVLAGRVPPSELVDDILRESAYAFEMRGRRLEQARENVKKVRLLVRRVESRGYATLERLAAYFETLRAGDESNAIVAAAGCVNLMTIHAAKGLEFPIVFVVNMHAAGRGRPAGFSVIERSTDGQPEVAFSTTDGTRLEDRRELEELRRLLYVAVTRARDRLYLAAEVDDRGRLRRPARSLAGLLPQGFGDQFGAAASGSADVVTWASRRGKFECAVSRPSGQRLTSAGVAAPDRDRVVAPPLTSSEPAIVSATVLVGGPAATADPTALDAGSRRSDRLVGLVVHRLFQRRASSAVSGDELEEQLPDILSPTELAEVDDSRQLAADTARRYAALREHPDVVATLAAGESHYEVPFSTVVDATSRQVIRGVVDCVVLDRHGGATVLEFKTGTPRPEHAAQAALYAAAVGAAIGRDDVRVKIIYP